MKRFLVCLVAFIIGTFGSFTVISYCKLPLTEELEITSEVFYTKTGSDTNTSSVSNINIADAEISVHFLELGNKYTGDCTYIKATGEDENGQPYETDILIDCGSKSNSISTVSEYLNKYVTDGKLEYVIVTHAHQDHYAGFATPANVKSIFDIYEIGNIIYFAKTNQKEKGLYANFLREINEAKNKGANVYTALDCVNENNGAKSSYTIGNNAEGDITLNILNSKYYTESATTENDYSVCSLIKTPSQKFLFTGDLEESGEKWLAENYKTGELSLADCDLYKAGHHGSKTSSSNALMSVVRPKVVCVCCCAGSPEYTKNVLNQFPTQKFIDEISKYTECVYVTTLCVNYDNDEFTSFNGNIVYMAKGENHNVQCSNNNIVLKNSGWLEKNQRVWTNDSIYKAPQVA